MKAICFYLPQYHRIPENDLWWGDGFTDWVNVQRARPIFEGHLQPHVPKDVGYYDLRDDGVRELQAAIAKQYGVDGFCYHHYWFNGKQLLEYPFNRALDTGKPDFPFCLCWANENWSRRWDGLDHDVLIGQSYDDYDYDQHIRWLVKAFSDRRYMTVDGKPLFLIYDPSVIPNMAAIIRHWRAQAITSGLPGLYLCSVHSHGNSMCFDRLISMGFDAIVEFKPHQDDRAHDLINVARNVVPKIINRGIDSLLMTKIIKRRRTVDIFRYDEMINRSIKNARAYSGKPYPVYPCVFPSWDNTARKPNNPVIIQNDDPSRFYAWLENAMKRVERYEEDKQLVFINAWNEWAEGCHIEPDEHFGYQYLKVIADLKKQSSMN